MSMVDDGSIIVSFKKAGFVDVHSRTFKLPATPWAKDQNLRQLGAFSQLAMEQDLDGMNSQDFLKVLRFIVIRELPDVPPVRRRLLTIPAPLGYAMYLFTNALGWSEQQVTVFLARVRKEMRDLRIQPYFLVEAVYGRKPEP